MTKFISLCGALVVASAGSASGESFPLTFHAIPAKDVMYFPGGSGTYGQLSQLRPASLTKEPKAISRHPLYGVCGDTPAGSAFLFRLDESRGDGKGYDRLIVDLNQNGDLTDDPVSYRGGQAADRRLSGFDHVLFGPIQAPAEKALAGGRPLVFAYVYIFNRPLLGSERAGESVISGQVELKAGWYLDTTVTVDGLKQKVGVFDGDGNLHLGDISRPQYRTNRAEVSWYFLSGDNLLVDAASSGSFTRDVLQSKAYPFGSILYLGGKAYRVALAPDCKSLSVEPWKEELAEVSLRPRGDQVRTITLAWQQPGGQWQLIRPEVTAGKIMVPPGDYRLYACNLVGKNGTRDEIMVSGTQRIPQTPSNITAGKANTINCGVPLEIKVTAANSRAASRSILGEDTGGARAASEPGLRINANVVGAGGEIYSVFREGSDFRAQPPKPSFTIVQDGRAIARGNLEFG
jgi:hypothetical protein